MAVVVLIAESHADARAWLDLQPAPPLDVVLVTPRSPHAARGFEANAILATPAGRELAGFARLLEESEPCVATRARRRRAERRLAGVYDPK